MKIDAVKTVQVEAKTISMSAKCSDMCSISLHDQDGNVIKVQEDGYVPGFFPGGGGDYVQLQIDIDTGRILNWSPTKEKIEAFIKGDCHY